MVVMVDLVVVVLVMMVLAVLILPHLHDKGKRQGLVLHILVVAVAVCKMAEIMVLGIRVVLVDPVLRIIIELGQMNKEQVVVAVVMDKQILAQVVLVAVVVVEQAQHPTKLPLDKVEQILVVAVVVAEQMAILQVGMLVLVL
jgi:hypothetical protein